MNPKVFISHASQDKDRFVTIFATKLRENGVDAWLDQWEMLPGDSLVDKIFEEGLKEANAVIIVLSENSISKPWVSEELNASIVARISKGTKIIPVVIDNCEVPVALKSTLWESIDDVSNYEEQLKRILAAVFEIREKPALGKPPKFVQEAARSIHGLSQVDSVVLKRSAAFDLDYNAYEIEPEKIFADLDRMGLTKSQILDSIEVLGADRYLKVSYYMGGGPDRYGCSYRLTPCGFEKYCESEIIDYKKLKDKCAGLIINEGVNDNETLAEKTGAKIRLINHIIDIFEIDNLVSSDKYLGGRIVIHHVSAQFRRLLA
jgi:hypothetical protein